MQRLAFLLLSGVLVGTVSAYAMYQVSLVWWGILVAYIVGGDVGLVVAGALLALKPRK